MRFKIDLASLIVGRKFTVFFTLYLRAISKYKPPGRGLTFGGAIQRMVFCVTILGGLYLEGLISEFYGILFAPVCLFNEGKYRTPVIPSLHVKW